MKKKIIWLLALTALLAVMFSVAACTSTVEMERDRYRAEDAKYDILDPDFDTSDSQSRVMLTQGHTRGTRVSSADDGAGTLSNLVDLNDETVYRSAAGTNADHKVSITLDLNKYYYIDRVDLVPAYGADKKAEFFPTEFYVEISCDQIEWTIVAARTNYPVPDHTVTLRMGAQSARYVRFTATSLREENGEYRLALGGIGVWFDDYRSVGKVAAEPNATYYISSSEGDDSFDGKTPETAWRTLNRANSLILSGGNRILLKKGDVWTGQMLQPYGDGSKDSPVVISSYGEGDQAPVIAAGGGLATGLLLSNVSWYTVQGIDFSDSPFGIKIESRLKNFDTETHEFDAVEGFVIKDCNFSDHRANSITDELFIMRYPDAYFGAGINLIAYGTRETWGERANNTSSPYIQEGDEPNNYIKNVQIENCDFERCDTGILNYLVDLQSLENGIGAAAPYYNNNCIPNEELTWAFHNRSMAGITIKDVTINESYRSGGIIIYGMSDVFCDNVNIYKTGVEGMHWGVAAMQISMCEDVVVQNSEFAEVYRRNNSPDGEGFDIEAGNINVTLKDSVIRDTAGPAVLVFGLNLGWGGYNRNSVFDNVLFENCGAYDTAMYQNVFHVTAESVATTTGSGSSLYQGNLGGVVKNCKIVLKWEGQGYETGYTVKGQDERGVYDETTDTTTLGLAFDASNEVWNPGERVQLFGNGTNLYESGLVSSGADYSVGYVDGNGQFVADPSLALDGSIYTGSNADTAIFRSDSLNDGEMSGGYEYNSGFSSVKFDTEDVNLSIMVDLGKEETFSAVRLFGAQRHLIGAAHYGTMFPRDLTISVSSDGVNWEQMDIHALDENGAAIRGGVKEIKDLTLASRPCQDMRFLLDVTARYVRVDITKAQADPAGSGYYVQIAELQVISGQQFDLKTEYVAVQ